MHIYTIATVPGITACIVMISSNYVVYSLAKYFLKSSKKVYTGLIIVSTFIVCSVSCNTTLMHGDLSGRHKVHTGSDNQRNSPPILSVTSSVSNFVVVVLGMDPRLTPLLVPLTVPRTMSVEERLKFSVVFF